VDNNLGNALTTIFRGIQLADNPEELKNITDFPEDQCTVQSAWALENIAKVAGSPIINPVFDFIYSKLSSTQWFDHFIAMISF
jgi:hypothetical protein